MMSRRRSSRGNLSGSLDSFLDIVTNCLGMLILISTLTAVTSRETIKEFTTKLGTPIVKEAPLGARPVYFECRGNHINPVTWQVVNNEFNAFAKASFVKRPQLMAMYNARRIANDFYSFQFRLRNGRPEVVFMPRNTDKAETIEQVRTEENGIFRTRLRELDPERDVLVVYVRPDSFRFFRELREVIREEGFRISWMPFKKPIVLGRGSGGLSIPIDS